MNFQIELLKSGITGKDTIIVGVFEDLELMKKSSIPLGFQKQLEMLKASGLKEFRGKGGETVILYSTEPDTLDLPKRLVLVGLGKKEVYSSERLRNAFGGAGSLCRDKNFRSVGLIIPDKKASRSPAKEDLYQRHVAMIEGLLLGAYRFDKYKSKKEKVEFRFEDIVVFMESGSMNNTVRKAIEFSRVTAEVTGIARDLMNTPANDLTPAALADQSIKMAKKYGFRIRVISGKDLVKNKMSGVIAVGKGSENPPQFIILEYIPRTGKLSRNSRPVVFVGKAVCFDSGGISLKPGANMDKMKNDMGGGAAVIGTIAGLAALKVPIRAVGLVPAVENLPSGSASRPGDIIKYANGKTVEILNTDAEGRLIMADALTYAERYNPVAVVDIATLTGSCVVALGKFAAGLMGNNEKLMETIEKVSITTGEKVWRFPLWQEYREQMKSDIADIKNVATREGGAINAAAFLLEFAEGYNWAHLDIAGTAWVEKSGTYTPLGATGFGTRLLIGLAKTISDQKLSF